MPERQATHECDRPGCTAVGRHRTVLGQLLCDHCDDVLVEAETGCLAGNGTPVPPAGWWRRLRRRLAA